MFQLQVAVLRLTDSHQHHLAMIFPAMFHIHLWMLTLHMVLTTWSSHSISCSLQLHPRTQPPVVLKETTLQRTTILLLTQTVLQTILLARTLQKYLVCVETTLTARRTCSTMIWNHTGNLHQTNRILFLRYVSLFNNIVSQYNFMFLP